MNKLQWNLNQNSYIFIQENAFENAIWKMAAILSPPQCVYTSEQLFHYSQSKCSSISQLVGSLDTIRGKFHLYLVRTTTRLCWHCSLLLDCRDQCIKKLSTIPRTPHIPWFGESKAGFWQRFLLNCIKSALKNIGYKIFIMKSLCPENSVL